MKTKIILLCFTLLLNMSAIEAKAQAPELAQLALNIEKLAQFKQILSDLKKGYEILSGGYKTIKDLSEGNFNLHKVFLDGLLEVSPTVKKYKRVADVVDYQLQLVKEYKAAFTRFKDGGWFNADELDYISKVYDNLFSLSLKNLDDLLTVVTAKKLRMNDDERLKAIDKIFEDMQDKLIFLRSFNSSTSLLMVQRLKEKREVKNMQGYYKP
ncbi:TerB family tellurite resistance protein [Pinibacter aurantiacus]|uniref:TerB family tellurite resistance protein n=1 Tax=Pinibacter aurantiacus TaxID=2851599 RepID=A0A9E2W5N7_9BACT|nr:TerB family tellurite resistance protein [Pinibacter aurantiacus]MBV4359074.1 TerB family tellurite resistance protein [Pinibacter aurantiacus]